MFPICSFVSSTKRNYRPCNKLSIHHLICNLVWMSVLEIPIEQDTGGRRICLFLLCLWYMTRSFLSPPLTHSLAFWYRLYIYSLPFWCTVLPHLCSYSKLKPPYTCTLTRRAKHSASHSLKVVFVSTWLKSNRHSVLFSIDSWEKMFSR